MTTPAKPKAAPKAAPKTAEKPAPKAAETDVFAFPKVEFPSALRDMAETSVQRSKEAYEQFKSSAEEASATLEETIEKTRASIVELNGKVIEVAKENTDATFAHVQDVVAVKSFSDVVELQTAFMKKQMETFQAQSKAFQEMTTKFTEETSAPYKAAFQKTVETFKVA